MPHEFTMSFPLRASLGDGLISAPAGSKAPRSLFDASTLKFKSCAFKKLSLGFAPLCSRCHPPQSRRLLSHLVCWLGPLRVRLPPQSMYGHQIHLPRTLLPTHRFPVLKPLMIPRHLGNNLAWHFTSVTTYPLYSCTHKYFLTVLQPGWLLHQS